MLRVCALLQSIYTMMQSYNHASSKLEQASRRRHVSVSGNAHELLFCILQDSSRAKALGLGRVQAVAFNDQDQQV